MQRSRELDWIKFAILNALDNKNAVVRHSFSFSLQIIDYCELLYQKKRFVISDQLLKSGTSIGAKVMEAQNSESKADFIHKMKIAAKEADKRNIGYFSVTIQNNTLIIQT